VRHLQALLSEKEEELKNTKADNSRLEVEFETYQQRVKALDESEHRYKDENWNLETQVHELLAAQKEAADREKKLTQTLNVLQVDKNSTQRELDEVKVSLSKLDEKHAAAVKQHDIELGTAKRKEIMADSERAVLQRKIDDLTSQNQELAKAFSLQRGRALEREAALGPTNDELQAGDDTATPEHSPPPSPIKGTPRHPGLESETMRTSLMHSQRTIQTLRNNIHREKTEKLELRRMLQDARDELERVRGEPNATTHRRSKKVESKDFKKPLRPSQLGGARSSRSEISWDDADWEDHDADATSLRTAVVGSGHRGLGAVVPTSERGVDHDFQTAAESTDANFETAAEASDGAAFETAAETDAAFETAHEGTETEDFQTGAEEFSGDDDDEATETETSPSKGAGRMKRPPILPYGHTRTSFESTASTSADDDDDGNYSFASDIKTPTALQPQKLRSRISRGGFNLGGRRSSRVASEEPNLNSSPASARFTRSVSGTPQAPAQSLFAELGEFDGSDDDESFNDGGMTPSRRSLRSVTPGSHTRGWTTASPPPALPLLPKAAMVEQGTMTDPVFIGPVVENRQAEPIAVTAAGTRTAMVDSGIMADDTEERQVAELSEALPRSSAFEERPTSMGSVVRYEKPAAATQWLGNELHDGERSTPVSARSYSDFGMQYDPDMGAKLAHFPSPPTSPRMLGQAPVPLITPPAKLSASHVHSEDVEPVAEPIARPVTLESLGISPTLSEQVQPTVQEVPEPPHLDVSSVLVSLDDEPVMPEAPLLAPITFAGMQAVEVHPREVKIEPIVIHVPTPVAVPSLEPSPVSLSIATVHAEEVRPQMGPEPVLPTLSIASGRAEEVHPEEIPAPAPVSLSIASLQAEELQPREEPKAAQPALSMALPHALEVAPVHEPPVLAPTLSHVDIVAQAVEPVSPPALEEEAPVLGLSTVRSLHTDPVEATPAVAVPLGFSSMQYVDSEPVPESPRSLKRESFIIPEDNFQAGQGQHDLPRTPTNALFGSYQTRNKNKATKGSPEALVIAEDETRQSLTASPVAETPDSQRPLKERSINTDARPAPGKDSVAMSDSGAQTSLTSNTIEEMLKAAEPKPAPAPLFVPASASTLAAGGNEIGDPFVATPGPLVVKRGSADDETGSVPDSPATAKRIVTPLPPLVRRSNSTSSNFGLSSPPPLPPNHREVIEAARLGSSNSGQGTIGLVSSTGGHGLVRLGSAGAGQDLPPLSPTGTGSMGPPPLPVKQSMESARLNSSAGGQGTISVGSMGPPLLPTHSRNRGHRPGTPKQSSISITSGRGTPTPRAGRADMYPPPSRGNTQLSRKSSMSSFVSELDNRFDIHHEMGIGASGVFGARNPTDPRMIRAITQVMIGEYLWKYTRKAGREEMSEKRHRRYFWLHPYNRTLYWSETDPGDTRRAEVKSKSLAIQAVRMVADTNPMPPGLHNKSLLVISGKRTIKFTAPTGQRHEIWFNALSFILKKPGEDEEVLGELADGITSDDVNEFNPGYSARAANGTRRAPSPSVMSYASRPSQSPAFDMSMNIPTLTPQRGQKTPQGRLSTISKLGSFVGSLRSRSVNGRRPSLYDATSETQFEENDSAEDLRAIIEQQDRESDRLENVRACCDGKFAPACAPRKVESSFLLIHVQANMMSESYIASVRKRDDTRTRTVTLLQPLRADGIRHWEAFAPGLELAIYSNNRAKSTHN
jgi:hypothetical protein